MQNATRTDGTHFLVVDRPLYFAVGVFPPAALDAARTRLASFCRLVNERTPLDDALSTEPTAVLALERIHDFEAARGSDPRLRVVFARLVGHDQPCLEIGSMVRLVDTSDLCDLADLVARSLADLLRAFGATNAVHATLD